MIQDTPPHDIETESALLGAILLDGVAGDSPTVQMVLSTVQAEDFYSTPHRKVYEAIQTVAIRGEPHDLVVIRAECRAAGILDEIGGVDFLTRLATSVESSANMEAYANRVVDYATRRAVLRSTTDLRLAALGGEGSADDLLELGESALFGLRRSSTATKPVPAQDIGVRLVDRWLGRVESPPVTSTGFMALDDLVLGLRPGQLVTVAGATSMGKTTFALNLTRYAIKAGEPVLLFSLEMGEDEVTSNLLCAEAGVDTRRVQRVHQMTDADRRHLDAANRSGFLRPLRVLDNPALTAAQIRAIARRDIGHRGTRLIVVDYVQLIAPGREDSRTTTREQQVAAISRAMKGLARETRVPVVILAQLNRDADKRPANERHPRLSDLRESAAIAHDSDVVLGMYRASYYDPGNRILANQIDVCVLKNRFGPTGRVQLAYSPASAFIGDLGVGL